MVTAAEIIARITIREADKLDKKSDRKEPLSSDDLENLETLAKIDRQLRPSTPSKPSGMSEEEALRIVEAHSA